MKNQTTFMNYSLLVIFLSFCSVYLSAQSNTQGPCSSDLHNQFDFWIGDWNVYHAAADTLVGRNTITRSMNGCVVEEHWRGTGGFEGKSFNTLNQRDSTWNQVWVDQSGATYHFKGQYKDQVMEMKGETLGQTGNTVFFNMSYHWNKEDDSVRQIWKSTTDGGKNWQTIFDGVYRKK